MKHSRRTAKYRIIAVVLSIITIFGALPLQSVFSLSDNDEYAAFDTISLSDLGLNETVVAPTSNGEIDSLLQYDSPIDTENFSRVVRFEYTPTGKKFGLQFYNKDEGKNNSLKIETSAISLIANASGDSNKSVSKALTRNTSYIIEFGMKKVVSGGHAGKMYMYVSIDGDMLLENYSSDTTGLQYTGIYGFNSTLKNIDIKNKVTFKANGSVYGTEQSIKRGQLIFTEPAAPVNSENPSLKFLGWFKENSITPWNFASDKVFEDTTLFAKFEGDIVTVSFDVNGGEPTVGDVSALKGGKLTEPTLPTKEGFEFLGWFAEGSDKPFDFSKSVNSSIVLTAKWLEIEYSDYDVITLRDLGLGEEVNIPSAEGTVGEKLTYENPKDTDTYSRVLKFQMIPPNTKYSTQIYYARNNWGNRLVIASGVCYIITKVPVEETIQALYKFEAGKEYDFEYGMIRILNGKNAGKMRLYLKINGEQMLETITADTENLSYTGIYGQGLTLKSVDTPLNITYKVGENIYSTDTANRGSLLTEPAEPKSPDVSTPAFFGWYADGERWLFNSNKVFRDVTLTAKFVKSAYKVTFDSDGGDYTPELQRVEGGKTATMPTAPEKDGLDFAYWQNTATGQKFDFKTTITGNVTLKAVYTLKKYTITFRALGKKVGTVQYTVADTKITEPKVPAVNGATGKWSSYTLDGGNKVVTAIYDGVSKTSDGKIKLSTYGDITVDARNTITRVLLDIADFLGLKRIISAEFDKSDRVFYDSQSIEFKWSDNSGSSKYTVLFADNKEFENSYVVETTKKVLTDVVGIFTPGKTYYWKVCGSSGSVSDVDSFVISDEACRWISSGAVTNMRDGGGWETFDGKRVKYGMIYRSGSYDEPESDWSYLDETAQYVFDYLGVKSEIELRADVNNGAPVFKEDGNYLHINGGAYEAAFDKGVQREYKKIFEFLADENNYPLIYHCSGGADRTGTLAYILNGYLGVGLEDLYRDFELTSLARPGLRLRDTAMSNNTMEEITERMLKDYGAQGGTFADAVKNYLINACEIAPETLEKVKSLLLEDFTPTADKVYYNVDFMVKGEKYLTQRIADGKTAYELLPNLAVDEISLYWSASEKGEKFDFSKPITKNTTLYLVTEKLTLEEPEELSLADLGIYEDFVPNGQSVYNYQSLTGKESRAFKFIYIPNGSYDLQIGFNGWCNRLWIPTMTEAYTLQDDDHGYFGQGNSFQKGKTYEMEYGMQKVLSGSKKGQYVLYLKVDGKQTNTYYSTVADNPFSILFYGTGHSILKNANIPVTATFKNGNATYKTVECSKGGLIPTFTNPTAPAGSYFAGWFESGKNYAWNFASDLITKSTEFTAKYATKLYTVTFDANGGTFNGSQSVKVGDGFAVKEPTEPTKDGYYFDGWYNGSKEFDFNTLVHSDIVLTAKWTKDVYEDCDILSLNDLGIYDKEYTVTDTFLQSYVSTTGKESRIFKFNYTPLNNPQLFVGFNGWDNRIWLTSGNEVVLSQDDNHSVIKPYTFETNKTYAVEYGMKKVISGKNVGKYYMYLKINDTLVGEYLSTIGNNPHKIMLYGTGTAKISEYPVPVKATFKANGSVYETQTVNRSNLLNVPTEPKSNDSSKPYFIAWMNGSTEWDFAKDKVYQDVVLTAKFVKSVNYVTFDYDCSDYENVKKKIEGGTKVAQPQAPSRKGYEFAGWYNGSKKFDFNTAVNSNIVLKAKWTKIEYEECDVISLNDLGLYEDKYTVVGENHFSYTSTTGKESRIFKFNFIPSDGSQIQIGFNSWKNRLWLTQASDLYLIAEDGTSTGSQYPFEIGKQYAVEYGMKKILNGTNKGKYYLYVSINGQLVSEYISDIGSNPQEILMYGDKKPTLKNASVPVKITYMVNGKVYKVQTVNRSNLTTEPAKPKSTDSSKPDFYGWMKKGSAEPVNFYTDRFYEDTVLTAEFAKNVHEVKFIDDGKVVKFFRTKGDTVIEEFQPVERFMKEYVWYNGNKPFDFTKPVTKDTTLTARWIDIELEDYDILSLYDLGIEGDYSGYHNSESFTPTYSKSNTTYSKIFRVVANMQDYRNFWVMFDDWGLKRFWMCADNTSNSASYVGLNSEWGYISLFFLDCELNRDYLMEFGLLRVKSGRYAGKDLIFVRIDGEVVAFAYTDELVDYGEAKYIDKKIYLRTEAVTFKNVDNFYNVVFKENGKEILTARVRRSETLYAWSLLSEKNILPDDPEVPADKRQAGMIFAGWYDQDGEHFDINSDPVMKDMVLEPEFGYTVTFDTGEKKKVVKVPAGWCVDEIEAPAKDGYRFDAWMLGDKKYDFSTPVNENITLKAKYIETCLVKFMAGDDVYRTYEIDKGSCVNKPKQEPDPYDFELDDTYVFYRWTLNGKKFDFDTKIMSDTVLNAVFITKSDLARIELLKKLAPYGGAVVFIVLAAVGILIFKRKREKKNV